MKKCMIGERYGSLVVIEKVKIPECRENIRRIRIMLGDLETSAVARSKIAKRKAEEAAAAAS